MSDSRSVTHMGKAVRLGGREIQVGDRMPDFVLQDQGGESFSSASLAQTETVFLTLPSFHSPAGSQTARRLDQELSRLDDRVQAAAVSLDLPFTLKRIQDDNPFLKITPLTDHRQGSFGQAFGMLIPKVRLLAQGIFVFGADRTVRYVQVVPSLDGQPDFDAVIRAIQDLL